MFLRWIKYHDISLELVESRVGKTVYAKIADTLCYFRHANLSHESYYFGFAEKDLDIGLGKSIKAILVCGEGNIEHIFILDFDILINFLRRGYEVVRRWYPYKDYQAKIFPKRDFEMTVTHRKGNPIDMRLYKVNLDKTEIITTLGLKPR